MEVVIRDVNTEWNNKRRVFHTLHWATALELHYCFSFGQTNKDFSVVPHLETLHHC